MLGLYIIFNSSFFNCQTSLCTVTWLKNVFIICFLFPPVIKLSVFSTLLGDLNILNCLSLTMLLFSRSWPNFYGFSWVFRVFNRKTKINALLILHILVIVFLSYIARIGFVFMPFWAFMSILVQDPLSSPAVTHFHHVLFPARKP